MTPPRAAPAVFALIALAAGLALAARHPVAPAPMLAGFVAAAALTWCRRGVWLAWLPATLPLLNFSPWTGWLIVDEFDIAVCAALAAGWWARAVDPASAAPLSPRQRIFMLLLGVSGAAAAVDGLVAGAGGEVPDLSWWQGEADPLNSVRVGKSLLWALALVPLLNDELRARPVLAEERLGRGMLLGLLVVTGAGVWERVAYPGLFDFSAPYRTVALFWEMHVGGAAIDAYLALAAPFVAWLLWRARTPAAWGVAALLVVLVVFTALTTFSRGVYLAVAAPWLALGLGLGWRRAGATQRKLLGTALLGAAWAGALASSFVVGGEPGLLLAALGQCVALAVVQRRRHRVQPANSPRRAASWMLATIVIAETVLVLGTGNYMADRLQATREDFGSRVAHWHKGLTLLRDPTDWALGIGLGRLPAAYAQLPGLGEFSGAARLVVAAGAEPFVRLDGPPTASRLAGLHRLTQRVPLVGDGALRATLVLRAAQRVDVGVGICEMHLLYERQCRSAEFRLEGRPGAAWQTVEVDLPWPALERGPWYAPRQGVFGLSVRRAGASVEVRSARLLGADGRDLLHNGDFRAGMARWFPAAQSYFLPWHIDNLYLEQLIERGAIGLGAFVALLAAALGAALRARHRPIAPFVAAALFGVLTVGLVSSVMDVPRVAFLVWLMAFFCLADDGAPLSSSGSDDRARAAPQTP